MTTQHSTLAAKVEKLAEIVADGNETKRSGTTVDEARRRQRDAAQEVLETDESAAAVEAVALPSERG